MVRISDEWLSETFLSYDFYKINAVPGITGFTKKDNKQTSKDLDASLSLMTYHDWYAKDVPFEDEQIIGSRVHLGILGDQESPFGKDGIFAWVEGEFYSHPNTQFSKISNATILVQAYQKGNLESFLSNLDGYFSAVIYDSIRNHILLISDRLGFKNLFYSTQNNIFSWNSELKGFLGFPHFKIEIEQKAVDCFLSLGYLIGDLTWFKGVKLMDASTILTYDLKTKKIIDKKRYWTWGKVKKQKISFEDAVVQLSELIQKAVKKRDYAKEVGAKSESRVGITLSGGLDSRAILAASKNSKNFGGVTFGKEGCEDIRIAKKVTQRLNLNHTILDINSQNWLENRLDSVWKSDGMSPLHHLHFGMHHATIKELFDINLNGILGEIALGGALLKRRDTRISKQIVEKKFGQFADLVPYADSFYDVDSEDVFWINTRSRRYIHAGSVEFSKTVEQRNPLADNDLLEFVYSLPDKYRAHSRLYIRALMEINYNLLKGIPWQRTGIAPSELKKTILIKKFKIPQIIDRLGIGTSKHFTNYPDWFRTPEAVSLFSEILNPKTAIYRQFVEEDFEQKYLKPHLSKKGNFVEMIGRVVTLEYWLKRILS